MYLLGTGHIQLPLIGLVIKHIARTAPNQQLSCHLNLNLGIDWPS